MFRIFDGGYGYDTTDLDTLRYRIKEVCARRFLYVVGASQSLHLQLVFEAECRVGWLIKDIESTHVQFGSVLGPDGKPFKTRSVESAKLMDFINEAVDAAYEVVSETKADEGL